MKKKRYTTQHRAPVAAAHRHTTKIPKDVAAFITTKQRTLGFTAKEFAAKLQSAGHALYEMMEVERKLRARYPGILESLVGRLEFGPGSMPALKNELRRLEKKFEAEQSWIENKRKLLHELMNAHAERRVSLSRATRRVHASPKQRGR